MVSSPGSKSGFAVLDGHHETHSWSLCRLEGSLLQNALTRFQILVIWESQAHPELCVFSGSFIYLLSHIRPPSTQVVSHHRERHCTGRWNVTVSRCLLQGTDASVQGDVSVKRGKPWGGGHCARRRRDEASNSAAEDLGCRGWRGGASRETERVLPPA